METKANYAIVGFFTVLVIAAAFGFVYWMANYGKSGQMAPLLVRIPGSASGLSVGSPVRFNGIQVGTIRVLTIDKANPNYVVARTLVRADAPVYKTTKANIEIQGLTGSSDIELTGGAVEGPNLLVKALETGQPATLEAAPSSVTNILSTADKILGKVNHIVGQLQGFTEDARGPLTSTIKNTQKFSQALADNSQGIDKFLSAVSSLSDTVRNLSGRLNSTLASVQKLVEAVDPNEVRSIVANADQTTREFATASAKLDSTLESFKKTADTYRAVGVKAQATLDHVNKLVAQVDPKQVGQAINNIRQASGEAKQALAQITQLTSQFSKHSDDIDETLTNVRDITRKLNTASTKADALLSKVNGFFGGGKGNASSVIAQAKSTLKAFKDVADTLNARIGPIADNLQHFTSSGLKGLDALIAEMRSAVGQIQSTLSTFEDNPQRLIFGGNDVKQYSGAGGRPRR